MSKIASKTENFRVFDDDTSLLGVAEVTRPNIKGAADSMKGSGILGSVEDVTLQLESMKVKLKFSATNDLTARLIAPKIHVLELRVAVREYDPSTGAYGEVGHKIRMKVKPLEFTGGKFAPGEKMDNEHEFEVYSYKEEINGKVMIEIDKFNNKFVVDGVDYLEKQRQIFGD